MPRTCVRQRQALPMQSPASASASAFQVDSRNQLYTVRGAGAVAAPRKPNSLQEILKRTSCLLLVGETGFEPATPWSRTGTGGIPPHTLGWHPGATFGKHGRAGSLDCGYRSTTPT